MAAAVGAGGCVWAIEPLPRNILRLQALKDDNELTQLTVVPVALGARESTGRLRLSSRPGGSGSGSFVAPWARPEHVEVEIARLDDLVAARAPARPLRLLKVDVEGFEAEFLAGAEATLTTHRPLVICEFHDPLLRAAGSSSEELLKAFARYRYHPRAPFARPTGPLHDTVVDMLLCPS
jgi:FkbM family methyltransferase